MAKKTKESISNVDQNYEDQEVNLRIIFYDYRQNYGEFELYTNVKELKLFIQALYSDKNYYLSEGIKFYDTYENVICQRFQPNYGLTGFYISVIKYVCSQGSVKENLRGCAFKGNQITAYINITEEFESFLEIETLPVDENGVIKGHYKYGRGDFMSFESKLNFLSQVEIDFLQFLLKIVQSTDGLFLKQTNDDFLKLWLENNKESDYLRGNGIEFIQGILNRLSMYDFISVKNKDNRFKPPRTREITILDVDSIASYFIDNKIL